MDKEENQGTLLETFPEKEISKEMRESYLSYAMSVIVSRALPDVRDGLKPVHRRILYAMHKLGLTSGAKYRKSAAVVGEVLAKYHPHGDSAVYDSMVRMAQNFSMRYMLVDGQGNFGSIDGDNAAAMRYTEAKMQKISSEMLSDLEKETVDFRDNYDGTQKEPSVLPTKIPGLLLNGGTGIAVGMATNIPPHNLGEVLDAVTHLSNNPEATIEDLMQFIKGPDFPTGGNIYDTKVIQEAYTTGRGSIIMRGVAEITEEKGRPSIIITEIPYQVNKANLVTKIAELVRDKQIVGITDIRDESSKGKIRIVVTLKRDSFPNKILNQIYKLTPLQSSFGCNFIALTDGGIQPRLLDLKSILEEFIAHRKIVITRRTEYELKIAKARAHILEGLKKALDHIDEIIRIIKSSETKEIARDNLIDAFGFTEIQANAILAMRLSTLAGLERKKIEDELNEKMLLIADLEDILAKPERVLLIMQEETQEVRDKYSDERRTRVIPHALGKMEALDTIPNEEKIITITQAGWIKRISPASFRTQGRGGKGLKGSVAKADDEMNIVLHTQNHNNLLFFTSHGRVFRLRAYEIPESSRTSKGQALVNFLSLNQDEHVTALLDETANNGSYLTMATEKGVIKKTSIEDFKNVRRSGLIAIKLNEDDLLRWVSFTSDGDDIMIITKHGKSIRFDQDDVRCMGRPAMGVRGISLKNTDKVIEMDVVSSGDENSQLLVVMENGLGKMTKVADFRKQKRSGSGVKAANITRKTGDIAGAKVVSTDFSGDLILTTKLGQSIRMSIEDIPSIGRSTQGVILMRPSEGDLLSGVSLIKIEETTMNEKQEKPEQDKNLQMDI
ncbi:MAG: DNA gyrase subunit A [Candidatus Gracilibacteria bacterium]|jgi:DNA gyrase subunit A|nr:DNA gyrase subunit A [Candidatus Gracilibacteria bacterium]